MKLLSNNLSCCLLVSAAVFPAGIEMKEFLLKPLEELPESTRCELLKGLQDVLEEGDALSLLGETVRLKHKPQDLGGS